MSVVGAPPQLIEHDRVTPHEDHVTLEVTDLVRISLVALAVVVSWLHPWQPLVGIDVTALVATLGGGYPIFREAMEAVLQRRMTMELSMTIALVAALVIGESFTAVASTYSSDRTQAAHRRYS